MQVDEWISRPVRPARNDTFELYAICLFRPDALLVLIVVSSNAVTAVVIGVRADFRIPSWDELLSVFVKIKQQNQNQLPPETAYQE